MLKYAELHECGGFASLLRAKETAEKASLQVVIGIDIITITILIIIILSNFVNIGGLYRQQCDGVKALGTSMVEAVMMVLQNTFSTLTKVSASLYISTFISSNPAQ